MTTALNTESGKLMRRMTRIRPQLSAAGIEMPQEITDAFELSKVTPDVKTNHAVDAAKARLNRAVTAEDVQAATADLAQAIAVRDAATTDEFNHSVDQKNYMTVLGAIDGQADGWFAELAERYNREAPVFTEAASKISDEAAKGKVMGLPREVHEAIMAAEESAERLNVYWNAYASLGNVLGYIDNPTSNSEPADFHEIVLLLGQPYNFAHLVDAGHAMRAERWGAEVPLRSLFPHIIGVRYCERLELLSNPGLTIERQDVLYGTRGPSETQVRDGMTGGLQPHFGN